MLPRVLALLLQRYAHLLRTDRIDVVVKLQHLVLHRRRRIRVGSAGVRAAFATRGSCIGPPNAAGRSACFHGALDSQEGCGWVLDNRASARRSEVTASPRAYAPGH